MLAERVGDALRSLRAVATTAWPAARAAWAMSTPRPRPAPVTSHTCFSVICDALPSADRRGAPPSGGADIETTSANEDVAVPLVRATDRDPHGVASRS